MPSRWAPTRGFKIEGPSRPWGPNGAKDDDGDNAHNAGPPAGPAAGNVFQGAKSQVPNYGQQSNAGWMHPMQQEGLASYHNAMQATNNAISKEMDSRVSQARDWDQMAHEQHLASMKHQSEMAGHQASMAMNQQNNQAKQARNSALMQAAGLGGTKIVNGRRVDGFAPFRQSLFG